MPETLTTESLHLPAHELQLVRTILKEHLPGRKVCAFGSRATGGRMLKRFSDLDIAVEGTLTSWERSTLVDAFDESLLPIKVDVVELGSVDPEFRERIERDFVVVQGGRAVSPQV